MAALGFLSHPGGADGLDSTRQTAAQNLVTFFSGIRALLHIAIAGGGSFADDVVNGVDDLRPSSVWG